MVPQVVILGEAERVSENLSDAQCYLKKKKKKKDEREGKERERGRERGGKEKKKFKAQFTYAWLLQISFKCAVIKQYDNANKVCLFQPTWRFPCKV